MGKCLCDECASIAKCKGYCAKHYARLKRYGSPYIVKKMPNGSNVSSHPLYRTWSGMADRCLTETNEEYPLYGGRGIKICKRWRPPYGFLNFIEDMGPRPKGYSIDRIDVNGDYCPENCRWANQSQQMNKTRRNKKYTVNGITGTFTELFRLVSPEGLKKKTAEARLYDRGWTVEKALLTPAKGKL